ncbi:MAG: carbohydrate-binding protein [Lachnospiraceae bacterium]|nr:carbohydrate-binding protein [Lachnospiraceae bacterium]
MEELWLKVLDQDGSVKAESRGTDEVNLFFRGTYQEGDQIVFGTSSPKMFVWLQLDDALGRSLVYLTGNASYIIPFGEKRANISPKAFLGEKHLLSIKKAKDYEINSYRNVALNVNDQHKIQNVYPHALANVETRGESVFAAQNAIDGVTINSSHGEWPFESWGINQQEDAKLKLDFGREVEIDRIILYTRADFPHDNWWKQVSFSFSDKSSIIMKMEKSEKPHEITFERKKISWLEMHDMKKSEDPSPFPALTQIEVYGTEGSNKD